MEHKYILLKDSDGYENLWEIIHETNGVYAISRCETMSVVLKDTCFNKGESILYSNVVRDFEFTPYIESDESYLKCLGIENYQPDEEYYAEHEKFMDCECYSCWMIGYDDEGLI